MDSFYLTLPSNSSMQIFPNNKQSSFTVKLPDVLNLTQPYEVALVEVNYMPNITTDLGDITIQTSSFESYRSNKVKVLLYERNEFITINLSTSVKLTIQQLLDQMNKKIDNSFKIFSSRYIYESLAVESSNEILEKIRIINDSKRLIEWEWGTRLAPMHHIEVFTSTVSGSLYYIIDTINSKFSVDYKLNGGVYDNSLLKWSFNIKNLKQLAKKYIMRIFIAYTIFNESQLKQDNNEIYLDGQSKYAGSFEAKLNTDFKNVEIETINEKIPRSERTGTELFKLKRTKDFCFDYHVTNDDISYMSIYELHTRIPKISLKGLINNKAILSIENPKNVLLRGVVSYLFFGQSTGMLSNYIQQLVDIKISLNSYATVNTNIIQPQFFGDVQAQVLKMIPIKSYEDSEIVTFFDNLHYVDVSKTVINSINITIQDLYGELIKFENNFSAVIIKLHFRKKQKNFNYE